MTYYLRINERDMLPLRWIDDLPSARGFAHAVSVAILGTQADRSYCDQVLSVELIEDRGDNWTTWLELDIVPRAKS